ncbi:MAG: acyltransferase [Edaphobacter sp.]
MSSSAKQEISFINTEASVLLDLIRGIAAILVLLSHWKVMFFVDYPKIPSHRIWFAIPYVISDAGHQAVLIFFVLSGYLISGSVFRSHKRGQWRWRTYLTHRFVRLWVVLLPGLFLGGVWDWIGLHYVNKANLYNSISAKSHGMNVSQNLVASTLLGNVAFLQTILVPNFGSNAALWSLANEFWYYILFPLAWLAFRRQTSVAGRILCLALLCPLMWATRSSVLPLFPVWLAGTALALLPVPRFERRTRIVAGVIYTPLIFIFAKVNILPSLLQDYLFGTITFLFFWILLSARELSGPSRANRLARQSARFSYTLYIVHLPALLLMTALFVGRRLWSPTDMHHDALALAILFALVVYAYLIASVTEFRTDRVRSWVERNLLRPRSAPPHAKDLASRGN